MHRCVRASVTRVSWCEYENSERATIIVRVHADGLEQDEVPNLVAGPACRACLGQ
jgi:predicted Fe-S protein YdhL (DUF1289 family)